MMNAKSSHAPFSCSLLVLVLIFCFITAEAQTLTFKLTKPAEDDAFPGVAMRLGTASLASVFGPGMPVPTGPAVDLSYLGIRRVDWEDCNANYKSSIDVEGNKIGRFGRRYRWLSADSVFAANNRIRRIKSGASVGVVYRDFSNNRLKALPEDFFDNQWLMYVDLSFNELESLPGKNSAVYLTDLNLSNNNLTRLPASANRFRSMRDLDLSENEFTTIPSGILRMRNLIYLDLSSNRITKIPSGLRRLIQLETLDLRGNEIEGKQLERLKRIIPKDCQLLI